MEHKFWHERWSKDEIGFHQQDVNPFLIKHWPTINSSANDTVFVPLCGKTVDLIWLAQRVGHVLGIELSQKAVDDFFNEHNIIPTVEPSGHFIKYQHQNLTILCGDFFQLQTADIQTCTLIYDRASLIAFPPQMRGLYVETLQQLFTQDHRQLLITLDYDQQLMNGPPFSVSADEVQHLFSDTHSIQCLEATQVIDNNQRFKNKGITSLLEPVFLLTAINL